ncbi:MAG: hypothetical protein IJ752_06175 [Alphaproteobacteria bacterium]|nr:hypothetical protein [Alphaproteobacteria bacterium]
MPNPYLKSVKMNPAANPHVDGYVNRYDPSAELTKAAGELAVALTNGYVKAKRREDEFTARRLVSDYQERLNAFVRDSALNEKSFDQSDDGRTNFDVDFEKEKERIKAEFDKECPSFERDNVYKLFKSIDLKAENDIKYLKIKKSTERTVANLNHIIETKTAAYAGMSAAEQEENDRKVEETLAAAFDGGVITADAREKAFDAYNYNKQKAQANHDILTRPDIAEKNLKKNAYGFKQNDLDEFRLKFAQVMKQYDLEDQRKRRLEDEATVLSILELIGEGRSIDTAIDAVSDPEIVEGLRKKQAALTSDQKDVSTDEGLYDSLMTMSVADPVNFKQLNLYKHIGDLDARAFKILKDRQNAIVLKGENGDKKENGFELKDSYLNPHENLKHSAYADLGLLKNSNDPETARQRLDFDTRYAEIAEAEIGRLGRKLTRDEEAAIVNNLVKEISIRKNWWFDPEIRAYQMTGKEAAYVPYKEIDKEQRKEIEGVFKNQFGVDLSSLSKSERQEAVEDMSAAFLLPEAARLARMKIILEGVAAKITGEDKDEVE